MSPTKEEVAGAVERLTDLSKSIDIGLTNLIPDLRTLLEAYASETAAREKAEDTGSDWWVSMARYRATEARAQTAERSLGEALEGLGLLLEDARRVGVDDGLADQIDADVFRTASDIYGRLKGEPQAGEPRE